MLSWGAGENLMLNVGPHLLCDFRKPREGQEPIPHGYQGMPVCKYFFLGVGGVGLTERPTSGSQTILLQLPALQDLPCKKGDVAANMGISCS